MMHTNFQACLPSTTATRRRCLTMAIAAILCNSNDIHAQNTHTATTVTQSSLSPSFIIDFDETSLKQSGARYPLGRNFALVEGRHGRPAVQFFGPKNPGVIQIPNRPELQFTDAVSFDFWVRVDKNEGMDGFHQISQDRWGMSLLAKSDDRIGFSLIINPQYPEGKYRILGYIKSYDQTWSHTMCDDFDNLPPIFLGEWFRITAVASRQRGTQVYMNKQLYLDCLNSRPDFHAANTQDLFIGRFKSDWYPFYGMIQDVRIYSVALTRQQVQELP